MTGAAQGQKAARDLTEASLEDLMNIEVTTVSKKEQKLAQAPAAVYVITHEDIRRSGMTSIPDLLRRVPGMQAGQIQGGAWAVSARGFNSELARPRSAPASTVSESRVESVPKPAHLVIPTYFENRMRGENWNVTERLFLDAA